MGIAVVWVKRQWHLRFVKECPRLCCAHRVLFRQGNFDVVHTPRQIPPVKTPARYGFFADSFQQLRLGFETSCSLIQQSNDLLPNSLHTMSGISHP